MAEYYDDREGRVDFDMAFYLEYARECGSPILELACGTGRVLLPLARAEFDVFGLDLSERMLAVCRRKLSEEKLSERVGLFWANMSTFDLPCKNLSLIYVPVRSGLCTCSLPRRRWAA